MNIPPTQPNLPPATSFPAGIVPLIWVLSLRLVPTILLSNEVIAGRASTTPAAATDALEVKYTTPYTLDHHLALIDGTDAASRLTTVAQWTEHIIRTSLNSLTLTYNLISTPDQLYVASICQEGHWEGEPCHISTVVVKTVFTKLDGMVSMIDRAAHLNFIDTAYWDCSTDVLFNQIPDAVNPNARQQIC